MPVSAEALKAITGLTNMTARRDGSVSQAMIDGCANYAGDPAIEARCHAATALIDAHIDAACAAVTDRRMSRRWPCRLPRACRGQHAAPMSS